MLPSLRSRDLIVRLVAAAVFVLGVIACTGSSQADLPPAAGRTVAVEVHARGYTPSEISATAGEPLRLVFTRTTDEGCGQQLVFPELNIRRDLPLDEAVAVDITVPQSGRLRFTCGMDMYRGAVVVR